MARLVTNRVKDTTKLGYARVSTTEQDLAGQRQRLREAGCWRVYEEKVSGAARKRPELARLLGDLRPGDVLVVARLDRLARSTAELLRIAEVLEEKEAGVAVARRALGRHDLTRGPHGADGVRRHRRVRARADRRAHRGRSAISAPAWGWPSAVRPSCAPISRRSPASSCAKASPSARSPEPSTSTPPPSTAASTKTEVCGAFLFRSAARPGHGRGPGPTHEGLLCAPMHNRTLGGTAAERRHGKTRLPTRGLKALSCQWMSSCVDPGAGVR